MTLNRIKSKQTLNLQFYKAEKLQRSNNKLKINKDSYTVIDITRKLKQNFWGIILTRTKLPSHPITGSQNREQLHFVNFHKFWHVKVYVN